MVSKITSKARISITGISFLLFLTLFAGLLSGCQSAGNASPTAAPTPTATAGAVTTGAATTAASTQQTTTAPQTTAPAIPTVTSTAAPTAAVPTTAAATSAAVPTTSAATSAAAQTTSAITSAPAPNTPTATSNLKLTDFSLFLLGDLNLSLGGSEVTGRVAVAKNANFVSYNLATGLPGNQDNVLVGGNINLSGGNVHGNVLYGGTLKNAGTAFLDGQPIQKGNSYDFNAAQAYADKIATAWANLPSTGTTTFQYGVITLAGNNSTQNVFQVNGDDLAKASSLKIEVPPAASLIINVSGSTISLGNIGIDLSNVNRQQVVFNFYQANQMALSSLNLEGIVWAPKATVNFSNGSLKGTLVAQGLNGGSVRFEYAPYTKPLPAV
ncbi:MAG TPA: choice-of-anchor A family protein [Chloroflexia bacterium]|nr:choice-of-anchor A family protein [Chloroflexia bacterium]